MLLDFIPQQRTRLEIDARFRSIRFGRFFFELPEQFHCQI
jgi:hypothetical protein